MIVTVISADFANIFVNTAQAAINEEINYQGKLTNASNVAVADGLYDMEFSLYTTLTGGSPIWTETLTTTNQVQVTNGLFSVMLGSTTPFTGVNFNQTLYLGVKIEADAEMSPRKIIGAVPAAMVAKTANALDGLSSSQFLRSDAQNATSSTNTFLNIIQTGTGKVAEFFGNVSQSVFSILSNGNVGIGTSTPYAALSVVGVSGVVADHYTSTSTTNASVFPYASTTALTVAGRTYTSDATVSNTITLANLNGPLQAVNGLVSATSTISPVFGGTGISTLPSYGNILVGQANGSYVLTATSSLGLSSFAFPFTPTTFGSTNANSTSTLIGFTNGLYSLASSTIGAGGQTTGLTISGGATTTGNAYFAGNVGIGTTSPFATLSIQGQTAQSGDAIPGLAVYGGSGKSNGGTDGTVGGKIILVGGTGGGSGVGTGGAGGVAEIYGGTGGSSAEVGGNGANVYIAGGIAGAGSTPGSVAGNLILAMNSSGVDIGNVGIGTSSPNWKLSVSGMGFFGDNVISSYFNATSTTRASTFPYASTTALSATTICITTDCRTSWPSASGGGYDFTPATNYGVANQATTGIAWFQNGLNASSTSHFNNNITLDTNGLTVGRASVAGYPLLVAANGNNIQFDTFTNFYLAGQGTGSAVQLQNANGDLLITNGVAGGAKLRLTAASGDVYLENTAAGALIFRNGVSAVERLKITTDGNVGIGTTTPGQKLSVAGDILGNNLIGTYFTSTSTTLASTFPYASTTAISATTICITTDCRTSWPSAGGGVYPFTPATNYGVNNQATTGIAWFQNGLNASSTSNFAYASTTAISATTICITGDTCRTTWPTSSGGGGLGWASTTSPNSDSIFSTALSNVGIGTTSPNWKLSVSGMGYFGDNVISSYFTATSSTATSTFAGGMNIGSGNLVYDYYTGVTSITSAEFGNLNFDTDAGAIAWVDMEVTTASVLNMVESYTAMLDGSPMLTIFGKSNGQGGIIASSTGVGIGTTTPLAMLDIFTGSSTPFSTGHMSNYNAVAITNQATSSFANTIKTGLNITSTGPWSGSGSSNVGLYISSVTGGTNNFDAIFNGGGNVGIGTTSPYAKLSVVGEIVGSYFSATSTTRASTFPYASTTALSATTICLTGDTCRTTWPTAGAGSGVDGVVVTTFVADGTWTKANYTGLSFTEVITTAGGGGGGGADSDGSAETGAGGGGAGGTALEMISAASLGTTETVLVSTAGGAGGTGNGAGGNGTAGGAASFGAHNSATGGGGGTGTTVSGTTCTNLDVGPGGAGAAATGGDINLTGGAGTGPVHCIAESVMGGVGGASYWGGGGAGGVSEAANSCSAGGSGTYGSGGGGAVCEDSTAGANGGAGTDGIVVTMNYTSSAADLAEWYETKDDVEAGDVVAISSDIIEYNTKIGLDNTSILEKAIANSNVVGVISTAPYKTMGADVLGSAKHPRAVALAGRVPVKVTEQNGKIRAGDLLTISPVPGHAMLSKKAGVTIGRALEDSNCVDGEVCKVMIMVHTSYSTGALLKSAYQLAGLDISVIPGNNNIARDISKAILAEMIQDKKDMMASTSISEVFTDRVVAGLEVITPTLYADDVFTNRLSGVNDEGLQLEFTDKGILFSDKAKTNISTSTATSSASSPVITFDTLGNAIFAGEIRADKVIGNNIIGLEVMAGKFSNLTTEVSSLIASSSASSTSLYENLLQNIANLIATSTVIESRLTTLENVKPFDINELLATSTETIFAGAVVMNGSLTINSIGSGTSTLSLLNDVEFFGIPYFTTDTAGFAIVKKGSKKVSVVFDREYLAQPIVNTSISFDTASSTEQESALAEEVFSQDIKFVVIGKNKKGFTILLNKAVKSDLQFSWTAFAVKGARTFESTEFEPEPEHSPVSVTPVVTPEPSPSTNSTVSNPTTSAVIDSHDISTTTESTSNPSTTPAPTPAPEIVEVETPTSSPEPSPESTPVESTPEPEQSEPAPVATESAPEEATPEPAPAPEPAPVVPEPSTP
jgi:hypothetical protein